jgi:Domain of unknown function (DUF4148)
MKISLFTSVLMLALAASVSGTAQGQGVALTRAEVKAEFLRARAAGELPSSAELFGPSLHHALQTPKQAPMSPAEVRAKAMQAPQSDVVASPKSAASATPR